MNRILNRIDSLHTFAMTSAFDHEDEGTAEVAPATVAAVINTVKSSFPTALSAHTVAKSIHHVLSSRGFEKDSTMLATSFCCDELCRSFEDELRNEFGGDNFSMGGIAGFPFGGSTSYGALCHHMPHDGSILIVYGPHVGIDYDGVVGKVNRRGHHGSGSCCNSAKAGLSYVQAVSNGTQIHSPDPSDPIDAQTVFLNNALLNHAERLNLAPNPEEEVNHVLFDCIDELLFRIMQKGAKQVPKATKIALLGGILVNTPEGTSEYFVPKKFHIVNGKGDLIEDVMAPLLGAPALDPKSAMMKKKESEILQAILEASGKDP